ncbi:hypothetical protein B0H14DRAFT_2579301 [Mycena olivaceomarginata]|nr:hypothetical protein B0H14DRAFT_2579301 [Mycena olivaceomarginata]
MYRPLVASKAQVVIRKQWPRVLDPALNNSVQGYKSSRSTAASKTITVWRWFANVHVKLCPGLASGFALASMTAGGSQRPQVVACRCLSGSVARAALDSEDIANSPVHTNMDTSRIKTKNDEKGMKSKNERGAVLPRHPRAAAYELGFKHWLRGPKNINTDSQAVSYVLTDVLFYPGMRIECTAKESENSHWKMNNFTDDFQKQFQPLRNYEIHDTRAVLGLHAVPVTGTAVVSTGPERERSVTRWPSFCLFKLTTCFQDPSTRRRPFSTGTAVKNAAKEPTERDAPRAAAQIRDHV